MEIATEGGLNWVETWLLIRMSRIMMASRRGIRNQSRPSPLETSVLATRRNLLGARGDAKHGSYLGFLNAESIVGFIPGSRVSRRLCHHLSKLATEMIL